VFYNREAYVCATNHAANCPSSSPCRSGVTEKPSRRATPGDVLKTIQRMSLLQIDTINIVARSPYLVCSAVLANILRNGLMTR
jgi:hypothetical protein